MSEANLFGKSFLWGKRASLEKVLDEQSELIWRMFWGREINSFRESFWRLEFGFQGAKIFFQKRFFFLDLIWKKILANEATSDWLREKLQQMNEIFEKTKSHAEQALEVGGRFCEEKGVFKSMGIREQTTF